MPKDRRVKPLSSDQSRSSPYHCSSNNTEQCKPQSSLGSDESVKKWKNVRCPISVDHPRDKAEDPRSSLRSTEDAKEWGEIRCPICMEHPHNAVLLQCSSFGKGCRPYMCNTSYRHSNCLDQFRKSSVPSPSTELLQETTSVSNNRTGEELELLGQTRHYESGLQPKLCCPLCRGEIYGWTVVKPAREFMNSRLRSCSLETCDFSGNYSELRKHSRSEHPFIQPSKVDPQRQLDWTNFEYERYVEDMYALTREEQEEPDWTNFEYERYVEDMAAMFALTMEEQEEPDWTNFEHERDVEDMAAMYALTMEEQEEPDWTNFEHERDVEDMAAMYALTMEEQEEPDWTMEEQEEPDWTNFEHERDVEDMAAMLAVTRGTRGARSRF